MTDLIHGGTDLVSGQPVVQIVTHEGYPVYLLTILCCGNSLEALPCLHRGFLGSRNGRMPASSSNSRGRLPRASCAAVTRAPSSGRRSSSSLSRSLPGHCDRQAGPWASSSPRGRAHSTSGSRHVSPQNPALWVRGKHVAIPQSHHLMEDPAESLSLSLSSQIAGGAAPMAGNNGSHQQHFGQTLVFRLVSY